MARPVAFPDPNDRSKNRPSIILSPEKVLSLHNRNTGDDKERVVDSVKNRFIEMAKEQGWDEAEFHGSQCVLSARVQVGEPQNEQENK